MFFDMMRGMEIDIKNPPDSPELLRKIIFDMQAEFASYKEKYARLLEEFRLDNVRDRIGRVGDLWKPLLASGGRTDLSKFL